MLHLNIIKVKTPEEMVKNYYSSAHALAPIQLLFRRRW